MAAPTPAATVTATPTVVTTPTGVRLLFCGDVDGNVSSFVSKVSKLVASHAFAAAFCVGRFIEANGTNQELMPFIEGKEKIPIPVYFITYDELSPLLSPAGCVVCPNLHFLGHSGTVELFGLRVAYLSGKFDPQYYYQPQRTLPYYTESDILSLLHSSSNSPLDLLLTSEWPQCSGRGCPPITRLAGILNMRYHFAAIEHTYMELAPYKNNIYFTRFFGLGAAAGPHASKTAKGLYAVNVVPFNMIDKEKIPADITECPFKLLGHKRHGEAIEEELIVEKRWRADPSEGHEGAARNPRYEDREPRGPPPGYICKRCQVPGHFIRDCTEPITSTKRPADVPPSNYICRKCNTGGHFIHACPLVLAENADKESRKAAGLPPANYVCRKCHEPGHFIEACPLIHGHANNNGQANEAAGCWFCLANESVASQLIICVGEEFYIALPKGPLVPNHLLLLPIHHIPNSTCLTPAQQAEFTRFIDAIESFYRAHDLVGLYYERNIPTKAGLHYHLQCVPLTTQQAQRCEEVLITESMIVEMGIKEIGDKRIIDALEEKEEEKTDTNTEAATVPAPAAPSPSASSPSSSSPSSSSSPFLYFRLPGPRHFLYRHQPAHRVPGLFDFPRAVCARILGQPAKVNWKSCELSAEEEAKAIERIKEQFKPYDITGTL